MLYDVVKQYCHADAPYEVIDEVILNRGVSIQKAGALLYKYEQTAIRMGTTLYIDGETGYARTTAEGEEWVFFRIRKQENNSLTSLVKTNP
ncbi:MAG: hypothetical protein KBT34_10470 [Prevotella sp.]|nr:hypothetical protein [Candidatus Prevotella equi]